MTVFLLLLPTYRRLESSLAREAELKASVEELRQVVDLKNRELGAAHDL
jgi:hypothetical protein